MPRYTKSSSKKRQAELLFDEFIKIERRRGSMKKEAPGFDVMSSFKGGNVVADSPSKFSGGFERKIHNVQSRSPYPNSERSPDQPCAEESFVMQEEAEAVTPPDQCCAEECPVRQEEAEAVTSPDKEQEASDEAIHNAAACICKVGDDIERVYKERLNKAALALEKKLVEMRNTLAYEAFSKIISELLAQERDIAPFYFAMQLSYHFMHQFGWSFVGYFRQYISEEFADQAVDCMERQFSSDNEHNN